MARIIASGRMAWRRVDQVSRQVEHYRLIIEERWQYDLNRTYARTHSLGDFVGVVFDIEITLRKSTNGSRIGDRAIRHGKPARVAPITRNR